MASSNIRNSAGKVCADRVERSEKMRQLLDMRLSGILRYGTVAVFLIFITMVVLLTFIPYPRGDGESILTHLLR